MIITLDKENLLLASKWNEEVLSRLKKTPNYTGLSIPDRFLIGYLGEIAVAELFSKNKVNYEHHIYLTGRSEKAEMIVWKDGVSKTLEVKTASKISYTRFMMPASQWDSSDLYIGVRIESPLNQETCQVNIMGWLTQDDVSKLSIGQFGTYHIDTRWCYLDMMKDISDLLWRLDHNAT